MNPPCCPIFVRDERFSTHQKFALGAAYLEDSINDRATPKVCQAMAPDNRVADGGREIAKACLCIDLWRGAVDWVSLCHMTCDHTSPGRLVKQFNQ